jgi:hypothetical protein
MKTKQLFIIALILCISLVLLVSCTSDDKDKKIPKWSDYLSPEDLNPANTDFHISVVNFAGNYDHNRNGEFVMIITAINPTLNQATIAMNINGSPVQDIHNYMNVWFVEYLFEANTNYLIEFTANNNNYSVSVKTPYVITNHNLPANYNPAQSYNLNWTMAGNNQHQFVSVYSESDDMENEDEWFKELQPSARNVTIPANAVDTFGADTYYSIGISQLNYKVQGRVVVLAISLVSYDYGNIYSTDFKTRYLQHIDNLKEKIVR